MLRQLARLTAPVEAAGPHACAIAVYADAADRAFPATDFGLEGVACVDDAARALILFCDLQSATRLPRFRAWAASALEFLLYMQTDDGRFVNFIYDWSGRRNESGITSLPGGGFWHARGVRALAKAALTFGDERARLAFERGFARIPAEGVPPDVRSIHVLMAVELLRTGRALGIRADVERWCDELVRFRRGDILLDDHDQEMPHLWGHQQEGALAEAGAYLGRDDLIEIARRSALAYLAPAIESGFDLSTVQPYGVAAAIHSVERLGAVLGDPHFDELARKGRAWFDGRNPAKKPVYDRATGRVHDGIDDGMLNPHSGAESNIVGAQALQGDVVAMIPTLMPMVDACFAPDVLPRLSVPAPV